MTIDEIQARAMAIIEDVSPHHYERIFIGNEHIFELARHFKGLFADTVEAMPYVEQWHSRWDDAIVDEFNEPIDWDLCWSMFIEAWDKVKSPKVDMVALVERAVNRTEPPPAMGWCDVPARILLASVCYELQLQVGFGNPFSLSGYQASEVLYGNREQQRQGSRVMDLLCNKKVLECTDRGRKGATGISAKYLYIGKD